MRKFLDFIVHSSLYVGIVGVSMIFTSLIFFSLPISYNLLLISFLFPFSVYNINRKTDIKEDKISHPSRLRFIKNYYKYLKPICIIAWVVSFLLALLANISVAGLLLFSTLMMLLYSVKWIPFLKTKKRFKEIFLIKNITVAFTWSIVVTFLPFLFYEKNITNYYTVIFVFLFFFLKVLGNTITFDIRDIKGDNASGIQTIPVRFGIPVTKNILTFINFLSFIILIIPTVFEFLPKASYLISLVFIYTQFYINKIGEKDIKFLTDVIADSEYIIIGLLALISLLVF